MNIFVTTNTMALSTSPGENPSSPFERITEILNGRKKVRGRAHCIEYHLSQHVPDLVLLGSSEGIYHVHADGKITFSENNLTIKDGGFLQQLTPPNRYTEDENDQEDMVLYILDDFAENPGK